MASAIFSLKNLSISWSSDLNYSKFGEKRNIYIQELHSINSISNRIQSLRLFFVTSTSENICIQICLILGKLFHWFVIVFDSWLCFLIRFFQVVAEFFHVLNELVVSYLEIFFWNNVIQLRIPLAKIEHQNESSTYYFNHPIFKKRRSFINRLTLFKYWYEFKPQMLLRPHFDTAPTI